MLKTWQLQEAKNRFSEVVTWALKNGPQVITKHGTEVAILLSYDDYRRLIASQHTRSVSAFFRESPLAQVALDLRRDSSHARPEPKL